MSVKKINLVNPRHAATVILIRDHKRGLQTYLLRRSRESGFFPGYYVFPGGVVDMEDKDPGFWMDHVDMDMDEVEEAGVLIAASRDKSIPENACENRLADGLLKGWLRDLVISEGWKLNLRFLSRWAHWITPKRMKYRFDTRFFLAIPPSEQSCMPDQKEMDTGIWISPEEALACNLEGKIPLSPPTIVTIHELLGYPDTESLKTQWDTRHWGETRLPCLVPSQNGPVILQPWDPQIHEDADIDTRGFEDLVLAPGEPFSRLYLHEGVWKPVRIP
jgi:8-oxo-dGTP pyrophosphatase MutT (NUDIX family)